MSNIFRKYNQNRKVFWIVIIIVAFFLILLRVGLRINQSNKVSELQSNYIANIVGNTTSTTNTVENTSNTAQTSTTNTTSESGSSSSNTVTAEDIINEFVSYCNNNDIESAYNMITADCKQVLFPTQDDFEQNYVQKIFTEKRTTKVEQSIYGSDIYTVTYYVDVLSSGGYSQEDLLQDYIFFTTEDDEIKISLNKFLYMEEINADSTNENVYIKVLKKEVYINYEIYKIQVTNNSDQTILLSNGDTDSVYITDENEVKYSSNVSELSTQALTLEASQSTIISIKFSKVYNTEREINAMVFSDIIVNYKEGQTEEEMDKISIGISI